jgi:iron(III) transport system ATP-binding protein
MVSVTLKSVVKRFDAVVAVDNISLDILRGELFFLLGPSGCGKTTLLRIVAGFWDVDAGQVLFDDRDVTRAPAHRRNTGMVFQNYALWPHLTVAQNVGYGLEIRKTPAAERQRLVGEVLAMVRMAEFGPRRPNQLSGGQQQRVALARALVIQPDVVLLDEPLSNLDAKLRLEMRDEIRRIHQQTGTTTIYVTHDQKEALSLAQRMAVLRNGRIEQVGSPREVYDRPRNRFVAQFIGQANFLEGEVTGSPLRDVYEVRTPFGPLRAMSEEAFRPGEAVTCSIRPESARLGRGGLGDNVLAARVTQTTYLGEQEQIHALLQPGDVPFLVLRWTSGDSVAADSNYVSFSPAGARLLRE